MSIVARQARTLRERRSASRLRARAAMFVTGCCNSHREEPHVDRQGPAALESHVDASSATAPPAGAAISGVIMRMFRMSLAALCVVSLVLTGCSKSNSNNNGSAQLRILNAFSEAAALNVSVASTSIAAGLPFQGLTQYTNITSGTPMFTVSAAGASTTLINTTYNVSSGAKYTYIVFGPLTGAGAILGNDAFNDPGNGFFSVRVVNAAPGSTAVDIYLTAPGADISSSAPSLGNISYGVTSTFSPIATSASFEIRVTPTGTKEVIFDSIPKTFAEHSATDLVVFGKGSGKLVNVALLTHDNAGTGTIVDNLLAQYKVVNASLVLSALNVFVDSTLQLSNLPYTGVSNYQKTT